MIFARTLIGIALLTTGFLGCSAQASSAEEEEGTGGGDEAGQAATRVDGPTAEEKLATLNARYKGATLKLKKPVHFDSFSVSGKPNLYETYLGLGSEWCSLWLNAEPSQPIVADPTDYAVSSITEDGRTVDIKLTEKGKASPESIVCFRNVDTSAETVLSWLSSRFAIVSLVAPPSSQNR